MSAPDLLAPLDSRPSPAAPAAALPILPLPKVLLCDLDGTVIDSMPILADLATDVIAEIHGMPRSLARELYVATCGLPFIRQLECIFPGDPRNLRASSLFEGRKPALCGHLRMSAEVRDVLGELRSRGAAIVLSSNNGLENVAAFAATAADMFDLVLGFGGGLAKGRPHIERAEATFGVDRSEMIFVGDSLHDGEIAEREGLAFVGVAGTFSAERFALRFPGAPVISRFGELRRLFGSGWSLASVAAQGGARLRLGNG